MKSESAVTTDSSLRALLFLVLMSSFFLMFACTPYSMQADDEDVDLDVIRARIAASEAKYALPMPMQRFFEGDVSVFGPMTIADIEEHSLKEMKRHPDVPQVPFGFMNSKWLEFRSLIREADEIYYFNTQTHEGSIAAGYAGDGYAVVRDGMVVDVFASSVY